MGQLQITLITITNNLFWLYSGEHSNFLSGINGICVCFPSTGTMKDTGFTDPRIQTGPMECVAILP